MNLICVFVPILTWSSLVSFESLYGMCLAFPSTRADITLPRADRDRFIFVASLRRSPEAPVFACLSLPAKSTKLNLPRLIDLMSSTSCDVPIISTDMVKIEWLLDESAFIMVAPVARFLQPCSINFWHSTTSCTAWWDNSVIHTRHDIIWNEHLLPRAVDAVGLHSYMYYRARILLGRDSPWAPASVYCPSSANPLLLRCIFRYTKPTPGIWHRPWQIWLRKRVRKPGVLFLVDSVVRLRPASRNSCRIPSARTRTPCNCNLPEFPVRRTNRVLIIAHYFAVLAETLHTRNEPFAEQLQGILTSTKGYAISL